MLSFMLSGNISTVTTHNNNRRHYLFTFTITYAYNEVYSYLTSNSYHVIHVDFTLFRFHITISMCHIFYKFQFLSSTCMAYHIIFKINLYVYNGNSEQSSHINLIQVQIRLISMHIRLLSLSRPKPLIDSLLQLRFMIWDARLKHFASLY